MRGMTTWRLSAAEIPTRTAPAAREARGDTEDSSSDIRSRISTARS
jgi:hypothetical protein